MAKEFERECVLFFEEVVQIFGVPKSVGQIYGVLYASPLPLSFSDIVERLEISKGSVSQGLQLLRSLNAINEAKCEEPRVKNQARSEKCDGADLVSRIPLSLIALPIAGDGPRSNRVTYEPELSLRQLISGVLRERVSPMATSGLDRLNRLRKLAGEAPENSNFYLRRAKQLETWRKRFNTVMPLLIALLGPKRKSK